jgi:ubiquitin carboxyl-terminal hydrolase L5
LEQEERKRTEWMWENALRRHNFVGFVGELLKGVVREKLAAGQGEYEKWIEEAKGRTRKRGGEMKGGGED